MDAFESHFQQAVKRIKILVFNFQVYQGKQSGVVILPVYTLPWRTHLKNAMLILLFINDFLAPIQVPKEPI